MAAAAGAEVMMMIVPRITSARGFTLVELVVASTLMALVLSGVYLTFSVAVRSWRGAEADIPVYEDARRAIGLLERDLHAIPPDAIHLLRGTSETLEFVTLAQPLDVQTATSERLIHVAYSIRRSQEGRELVREEALVIMPLPAPPTPPATEPLAPLKLDRAQEFVIASDVEGFHLEYGWAAPSPPHPAELPPFPVPILTDSSVDWVLPESIDVSVDLDDPGNISTGVTRFETHITFRQPTSPIPDSLRRRGGF